MEADYKETFDRISLYVLALLLSPVLFAAILAVYTVITFDDSWGFVPTLLVVALYSFLFFALTAFPVSLYIDFSNRTKSYSTKIKCLMYAVFGALAGFIGSLILYDMYSIFFMLIFGMIGGIIHFVVLMVLKKIIK